MSIENFDHRAYRNSLASELGKEKNSRQRRRILRQAQRTTEYGLARQLHGVDQELKLSPERQALYGSLAEKAGNTPLIEYQGEVPNKNKIFLKLESENPFGKTHYDRVYLKLFLEKEKLGLIHANDDVFETTSGSAGISFAAIGRELGYKCHVAMPAGGEKAREQAITDQGAELILTPREDYINGFRTFIPGYQKEHPDHFFINHSMGNIMGKGTDVNENAVSAMEDIAEESLEQLREQTAFDHFDYVFSAIGNGTNTLGIGRKMKELSPDTKLIGYETMSSAVAYQLKNPGLYEKRFDINNTGNVKPENFSRHRMPGTSFPGIAFPAIERSVHDFVDEVVLVADEETERKYKQLAETDTAPDGVVRWDTSQLDEELKGFGRSTKAGLAVALENTRQV